MNKLRGRRSGVFVDHRQYVGSGEPVETHDLHDNGSNYRKRERKNKTSEKQTPSLERLNSANCSGSTTTLVTATSSSSSLTLVSDDYQLPLPSSCSEAASSQYVYDHQEGSTNDNYSARYEYPSSTSLPPPLRPSVAASGTRPKRILKKNNCSSGSSCSSQSVGSSISLGAGSWKSKRKSPESAISRQARAREAHRAFINAPSADKRSIKVDLCPTVTPAMARQILADVARFCGFCEEQSISENVFIVHELHHHRVLCGPRRETHFEFPVVQELVVRDYGEGSTSYSTLYLSWLNVHPRLVRQGAGGGSMTLLSQGLAHLMGKKIRVSRKGFENLIEEIVGRWRATLFQKEYALEAATLENHPDAPWKTLDPDEVDYEDSDDEYVSHTGLLTSTGVEHDSSCSSKSTESSCSDVFCEMSSHSLPCPPPPIHVSPVPSKKNQWSTTAPRESQSSIASRADSAHDYTKLPPRPKALLRTTSSSSTFSILTLSDDEEEDDTHIINTEHDSVMEGRSRAQSPPIGKVKRAATSVTSKKPSFATSRRTITRPKSALKLPYDKTAQHHGPKKMLSVKFSEEEEICHLKMSKVHREARMGSGCKATNRYGEMRPFTSTRTGYPVYIAPVTSEPAPNVGLLGKEAQEYGSDQYLKVTNTTPCPEPPSRPPQGPSGNIRGNSFFQERGRIHAHRKVEPPRHRPLQSCASALDSLMAPPLDFASIAASPSSVGAVGRPSVSKRSESAGLVVEEKKEALDEELFSLSADQNSNTQNQQHWSPNVKARQQATRRQSKNFKSEQPKQPHERFLQDQIEALQLKREASRQQQEDFQHYHCNIATERKPPLLRRQDTEPTVATVLLDLYNRSSTQSSSVSSSPQPAMTA